MCVGRERVREAAIGRRGTRGWWLINVVVTAACVCVSGGPARPRSTASGAAAGARGIAGRDTPLVCQKRRGGPAVGHSPVVGIQVARLGQRWSEREGRRTAGRAVGLLRAFLRGRRCAELHAIVVGTGKEVLRLKAARHAATDAGAVSAEKAITGEDPGRQALVRACARSALALVANASRLASHRGRRALVVHTPRAAFRGRAAREGSRVARLPTAAGRRGSTHSSARSGAGVRAHRPQRSRGSAAADGHRCSGIAARRAGGSTMRERGSPATAGDCGGAVCSRRAEGRGRAPAAREEAGNHRDGCSPPAHRCAHSRQRIIRRVATDSEAR